MSSEGENNNMLFAFNLLHQKMLDKKQEVLGVMGFFFSNTLLKIGRENFIISTHVSGFHFPACFVSERCSYKCLRSENHGIEWVEKGGKRRRKVYGRGP